MDEIAIPRGSNLFASKGDEEENGSVAVTEEAILHKSLRSSHFNFDNIRFTPRIIEFKDAFEGKQLSVTWKIQNIGRDPIIIKIGEPNSFIFQLKYPYPHAIFLASGSSIVKTICYTYHNDDLVQRSQIPVQIDGIWFDYPIVVKKAVPEVEVYPQKLHFKTVNLGATATSMILTIRNKGGKRTKFEIDVGKNEMNLVVNPMQGTVKPKESVEVNVEMMGCTEGEFYQEIWIKTSDLPIRVPVLVEVVRPHLQVVHPKGTENFTLISFRPAYRGTQSANSFILRNYSTEATLFVILAEINGELHDLNKRRKYSDAYRMFKVTAEEGLLAPFESRIVKVLFCPKALVKKKGWQHKEVRQKNQTDGQYTVFLRINRVHCIEQKELAKLQFKSIRQKMSDKTDAEKGGKEHSEIRRTFVYEAQTEANFLETIDDFLMDTPEQEEEVVRLCLHGQAIEPDFLLEPTSFEYDDLNVGQTAKKILKITNNGIIPIKCALSKVRNLTVTPNDVWIKTEKSEEFLLSLTPSFAGVFKTNLKVVLLAESDDVLKLDKNLVAIAEYNVVLTYKSRDLRVVPAPKVGMGITPLIKDEVGLQKDIITYKDVQNLPRAAMLGLKYGFKPAWMAKEKNQTQNVDNAIVALPNDRPKLFYTWPKDKICRTIFTGFFRYSPPEDLAYTLSAEGRIQKKMRQDIWFEFLSKKLNKPEIVSYCLECDETYKSCGEIQYKPNPNDFTPNTEWCKKYMGFKDAYPENSLVPLTPLFLYHIHVEPRLINFSTVAADIRARETVTIKNTNPFPISIRFVSGKSAVYLLEEGTITLQPSGTKSISVFLQTNDLGHYFGFLNYIINGSHEFKITISAFVTPKSLILRDKDLNLEFGKYDMKEPFQVRSVFLPVQNILQAPVSYRWQFSTDSAYSTEIMNGEIPPRSKLLIEILFNLSPTNSFYSETTFYSESGCSKLVKLAHPYKKVIVDFLTNRVDMHDIPLNLPTKVRPIIQNSCYHDVSFEVLTSDPMPGVTVEPKYGVIKSRSFFPLDVVVQVPVIMKFSFEVTLLIHFVTKISVKIVGNVVLPVIKLKPSEVTLQKICAQSFDTFTICATNAGTTPAEMEINLKSCPELTTSDGQSEWYLPPKKTVKIAINFEPLEATRYVFYLPVIINRMLGPPLVQESETEFVSFYTSKQEAVYKNFGKVNESQNSRTRLPCIFLSCHITQKILDISTLDIEFRKKSADAVFQPQIIEIFNNFVDEVTFCIRNDDLGEINGSPFSLTPITYDHVDYRLRSLKVTLRRGDKIELKASFNPQKPDNYKVAVPIFIRGYNNGFVFNYIRMRGHLSPPHIRPMFSEVHFPPVPLGVGYDIILSVHAENYYNYDVIHCGVWKPKSLANSKAELTTSWLAEPQVTTECGLRQEFKLQINFQSPDPVDLRAYVLLLDSSGGYATILVTAVADNSTLTTHAFLATKSYSYKFVRETPASWKKDEPIIPTSPVKKSNLKHVETVDKKTPKVQQAVEISPEVKPADKGPKLILSTRKSIIKPTILGVPDLSRGLSATAINIVKVEPISSFSVSSRTDNSMGSTVVGSAAIRKKRKSMNEFTFPYFPAEGSIHRQYFVKTLTYVERWIFEVAMRCEHYYSIPQSFQQLKLKKVAHKLHMVKDNNIENTLYKDVLDFLEEVTGKDPNLPLRPLYQENNSFECANAMYTFHVEMLRYLQSKGCLFSHVRPEYLLDYDHYLLFCRGSQYSDSFTWNSDDGLASFLRLPKEALNLKYRQEGDTLAKGSGAFSSEDLLSAKKSGLFYDDSRASTVTVLVDPVSPSERQQNADMINELATGRRFEHKKDVMDKGRFLYRSTQAWFDISIQIFKVFVLNKVVHKSTIHQVVELDLNEKIFETTDLFAIPNYNKKVKGAPSVTSTNILTTNIYSHQEIILLNWLSYHLNIQKRILWKMMDPCPKTLNCFDKDLSDSLAFIAVTASHCPYIVHEYFDDVFAKPDTLNKLHHNAGKLIMAWRALEIGLTVETGDIVNPNPVFMVMLVTHLYEILPSLNPHSLIYFSAPLNSELIRTIQVKNESPERLTYKAKFFGEHEGYFRVDNSSEIELGPFKIINIDIIFRARKIIKTSGERIQSDTEAETGTSRWTDIFVANRQPCQGKKEAECNIAATLLLSGCSVSPNFGKPMTFYLEGEPSGLPEHDRFSFSAPLYKVICSEIPVKAPYSDHTTYEICYTTNQPIYKDDVDIGTEVKPWSKIWKRKVSRRLFLNQDEIMIHEKRKETPLSITIACLTPKKRSFWLLFRSKISDFIILIEITPKIVEPQTILHCYYPGTLTQDSVCRCQHTTSKSLKPNVVACPFLTTINIPTRNDALWKALQTMFMKTLNPEEKSFWAEHFETDIGICLILWLLSPEEEAEVIDEFVHVLSSRVEYFLQLETPPNKIITTLPKVEILDVRQISQIPLPIHVTKRWTKKQSFKLTMTSENGKEVRNLKVYLQRPNPEIKVSNGQLEEKPDS